MGRLYALLSSRLLLFAAFQAVIALALGSWQASTGWWTVTAGLTNLVSIGLLFVVARSEGVGLRQVFAPHSEGTVPGDLLWLFALLVVLVPVAQGPGLLLGWWWWGDPAAPMAELVHPIPHAAAWFGLIVFPLTIALAELPTYYGLIRPRLEARGVAPVVAIGLTAGFHALQHASLPLVFDLRFAAWRALMFMGFALVMAVVLRLRPRLMPWAMGGHALIDLSAAWFVLDAAVG